MNKPFQNNMHVRGCRYVESGGHSECNCEARNDPTLASVHPYQKIEVWTEQDKADYAMLMEAFHS